MELFFGFTGMAAACLFFVLFWYQRFENIKFKGASLIEGKVIDLRRSTSHSYYPIVEYRYLGELRTFMNAQSINDVSVGQLIDLELAADGKVRVKTSNNATMQYALLAGYIVIGLFSILVFIQGGNL